MLLIDAFNHYRGKHNFLLTFATRCLYWQAYSTCTVHALMRVYVCMHTRFGCRAVKLLGQPSTLILLWWFLGISSIQNDVFISACSQETLTLCASSDWTFYMYGQKRSSSTMSAMFVRKPRTDNINTGFYKARLHFSCFKWPRQGNVRHGVFSQLQFAISPIETHLILDTGLNN